MKGVTYVLHQAAFRSVPKSVDNPRAANDNNATGTLNALMAAKEAGVKRFVYAATSSAYGECRVFPQRESLPTAPVSPYAVSKLACEALADSLLIPARIPACHLRISGPFGPHQAMTTVVKKFLTHVVRGEEISIWGTGRRTQNYVFEEDIAQAVFLALGREAGGVFNISGENSVSTRELAELCVKVVGRERGARIVHCGNDPQEQHRGVYPCEKAKRNLGYSPISLFDGLSRTAISLREQCE
jgi:UDP-glucose 4-epimerase